ncbi:MAG: serine/threonine protein kinase [Deltaproteobacteria bacterium]|nr:serine/threonine protein kinase [Deltaproteobacteria bacterium]MDQ3297535.1 serine/threonine protein kinase [Myxococcota bacterium]
MDASTQLEIPGFRLDRLVGEGGFGQVWRACRINNDAECVAIKILHLELVRSIDALTRFQRELDAISRLHHPNVVRAIDHGTLGDGRPYLVLELLEGPSLRDVIHDRGAIPPAEMLEILQPLCDALAVAHDAGLVHRDVKASNVILSHHPDGRLRPVLLDFGLVKLVDETGPGLTSSRSMLGTPAAMAPEQMRGQPVDARTDVYALGLLAFHMLTGMPAFGGAPGVVQSYLQIHGARPRPSSKVDIDPAIDEPITCALAPDPAARYASTRELVDALRVVIHPSVGDEVDVIAFYAEVAPDDIATVKSVVCAAGMTVAIEAPDSILAVALRAATDVDVLKGGLARVGSLHAALGSSRATLHGQVVDGPALDVESWAPYPLAAGLWVGDGI